MDSTTRSSAINRDLAVRRPDRLMNPACWIISKQQMWKQMAYSYVKQSDVKQYWTLASEYGARRQRVCVEQRPDVRRASILDRW